MPVSHKPPGHPTVSPYLLLTGADGTIDFLVQVLGAELIARVPAPDGKVRHSEVRLEDSIIMLADAPPGWLAVPAHVHIYVEDVDATYRKALEYGATAVQEPVRKDEPGQTRWREGRWRHDMVDCDQARVGPMVRRMLLLILCGIASYL